MKRLFLSGSLIIAATTIALAGNPKETKEAKAQDVLTTYYVTGQSGSNYLISTNPANNAQCTNDGSVPCRFTSPDASLGSSVPKAKVDGELDDIDIEATRPSLP